MHNEYRECINCGKQKALGSVLLSALYMLAVSLNNVTNNLDIPEIFTEIVSFPHSVNG